MILKDILTIDLTEEIKSVIDLEDMNEAETKAEIDNYIITDGLAAEYCKFVNQYKERTLETGVWISGFYGSGKSYFAKLLGYLLSNRNIAGTPARERILQRFTGIKDEALVKMNINELARINTQVIFFDIAKQDTSKGMPYTLFVNYLKSIGLPQNEYGILLYHLLINHNSVNVEQFIAEKTGQSWSEIKGNRIKYIRTIKEIYMQLGHSEIDYNLAMDAIGKDTAQFAAAALQEEIQKYLQIEKDTRLVFLFDETSEAISQKKINLLELEGITEAMTALNGRVWTVAIAQEKLDDVISNANIDKAKLTKVTDRFKTKIHLEATEVDVIIRNRLLSKNESGLQDLQKFYRMQPNKITDFSTLEASNTPRTDTELLFTEYYPFHKYQFDLLQNFLFGGGGATSTKVAARGMIITAYEILRNRLQTQPLYLMATGWQIAAQAQTQPDARMVNQFSNADKILKEIGSEISGRHLLETINFLDESNTPKPSLINIVKTYISSADDYYPTVPKIEKALEALIDAKILLLNDQKYKITTDTEQKILDEMNSYPVQSYFKVKALMDAYRQTDFVKELDYANDAGQQYKFWVASDNGDDLMNKSDQELRFKILSLYKMSDNRAENIEAMREQHQNDKDMICIVPNNEDFREIDKLIEYIIRFDYIKPKYSDKLSEEYKIVRALENSKTEKIVKLNSLIEKTLNTATAVYLYEPIILSADNWQLTMQTLQKKMARVIYSKRVDAQLSDTKAEQLIKETKDENLYKIFASDGSNYQYFDAKGVFVGDMLPVADEILFRLKSREWFGEELEKELRKAPFAYQYGTVAATVAALMRGGKITAKHNGSDKFTWQADGVREIFTSSREFRKASFRAIARKLTMQQKSQIVNILKGLNISDNIGLNIDWNTNDFDLVKAIAEFANRFCNKVDDLARSHSEFHLLADEAKKSKFDLLAFDMSVNMGNYIDRAEEFLNNSEAYSAAIVSIERIEKFMLMNIGNIRRWTEFIGKVNEELRKSAHSSETLEKLNAEFETMKQSGLISNYKAMEKKVQHIKDHYYDLMKAAVSDMADKYSKIKAKAEELINYIQTLPAAPNRNNLEKAKAIVLYAEQRTQSEIRLELDIRDQITKFTFSEVLSFVDLYNTKNTDLDIINANLILTAPPPPEIIASESPTAEAMPEPKAPIAKTFSTRMPANKMKVSAYKKWLSDELRKIAAADDNDEVEIA